MEHMKLTKSTDFNGWMTRFCALVDRQQSLSDEIYMEKWEAKVAKAAERNKGPETVTPPYKFPHTWESFLTKDPEVDSSFERLIDFEKAQFLTAKKKITSQYGDWFSEFLPREFIDTLPQKLNEYKVYEVMSKLKLTYGNENGVTLKEKILAAVRFSFQEYKSVQKWLNTLKLKANQATSLGQNLLGRELMFRDVLVASVLDSLPPEVWSGKNSMSDEDFTLEKIEALIAETYQNKSYAEINPGKKRRAESELVGVNHSTLNNTNKKHKVFKSKDGKKGNSTNKGNCHFCFKNRHLKSGCKMREAEFDQKIFRSSIHHDPNTKKNMGKVVLWKKVDGELQVYSIEPVKEKEDTWDQSPGSSAPSNIVFQSLIHSLLPRSR